MGNNWGKKNLKYQKNKGKQQIEFTDEDVFSMMNDTRQIIAQESTTRLSEMSSIVSESGKLVDSVEYYSWLDKNYKNSHIFASSDNMKAYMSKSQTNVNWMKKVIQGKGYEFDYISSQRKMLKNLFKSYDAGNIANRPGSDITIYDSLTGTETELQLKAYTSKNAPHLKNTPKDMKVVTNAEKVEVVKNMGYKKVETFGDIKSIEKSRDSRLEDIASGKATPNYEIKNVGATIAKAGIFGFVIGITTEMVALYKKWERGKINTYDYLKEIMKSGGNASTTSMFSAGIMIPITATITASGVSSLITYPITFIVTTTVDKVIAPTFARGEYKKIFEEATYYRSLAKFCNSLVNAMNNTTLQYSDFVDKIVLQQKEFKALAKDVISQQAIDDFEYYASLPKEELNKMISGMIGLLDDIDSMYDSLKEQNWFERMLKTVTGKNKTTKDEIHRNYEKIEVYISKAIEVLFKRQCISEEILKVYGDEINYLLKEFISTRKKVDEHDITLKSVESKINAVMNSLFLINKPNLENQIVSGQQIVDDAAKKKYQEAEKLFMEGKLIEAMSIFEDAANNGVGRAYYYLGEYYINGYGHIKEDEIRAIEYWRKGMELGDPLSTYEYGLFKYINDDYQCEKWIEEHIPSILQLMKSEDLVAYFIFGNHFVAKCQANNKLNDIFNSIADSLPYLKFAAQKGYWPAAFSFYTAIEGIRKSGVIMPNYVNLFIKVEWYKVQYLYAMWETLFGTNNYDKCAQYFQKSLWLREDKTEAAGFLAFLLNASLVQDSIANGISKGNAPMYYQAGLESKDEIMLYQVGLLYLNGISRDAKKDLYEENIGKDIPKAYEYLQKSYSIFSEKSKNNQPVMVAVYGIVAGLLGSLYLSSEGPLMSLDTAYKYLTIGYNLGDPMSTKLLAACYREGWGVDKNTSKADELMKENR